MTAPVCRECAQGKCVNCAGLSLDEHDDSVDCDCPCGDGDD